MGEEEILERETMGGRANQPRVGGIVMLMKMTEFRIRDVIRFGWQRS